MGRVNPLLDGLAKVFFVVGSLASVAFFIWSLQREAPRSVFGSPIPVTTEEGLEKKGYIELNDAWFDCNRRQVGSGEVPIGHPVKGATMTFSRESVCRGHNASRVVGKLAPGRRGGEWILQSLAPIDDPVLLGLIVSAIGFLVALLPMLKLKNKTRSELRGDLLERRIRFELTTEWYLNRLGLVLAAVVFVGLCIFGANYCIERVWSIAVVEPKVWQLGEKRGPVVVEKGEQANLHVTWMEGRQPRGLSCGMLVQLESPFGEEPEVRVLGDRASANLCTHHRGSRLLVPIIGAILCIVLLYFLIFNGISSLIEDFRFARAVRRGNAKLEWRRVLRQQDVTTGKKGKELSIETPGGKPQRIFASAPREPAIENGSVLLVARGPGGRKAHLVFRDGYPFRLRTRP